MHKLVVRGQCTGLYACLRAGKVCVPQPGTPRCTAQGEGNRAHRTMTADELAAARWSLIDFGSATPLVQQQQQEAAAGRGQGPLPAAAAASNSGVSAAGMLSWLMGGLQGGAAALGMAGKVQQPLTTVYKAAADDMYCWVAAADAPPAYETPAYAPPEVCNTSHASRTDAACSLHCCMTLTIMYA